MIPVIIKRIYEESSKNDGYRILVDRIWPRGISKEKANLDEWTKNIAPSTELRKWFNHKEERFEEFSSKYKAELLQDREELKRIQEIAEVKQVMLLYAAKDTHLNQATVLQNILNTTL